MQERLESGAVACYDIGAPMGQIIVIMTKTKRF